ncbi:hypothetical protein KOW79_000641 [Hemibagrus wyckioides]|uniref:Uncharacterized protein n=1 Tax=Hemibagrus wyckioides TaxID=337641 RepID=A0A9D3P765_9TELE|nr:hypothetical protein KOW79_000641 [Hemibagrus wyckioides]
MAPDISSKQKVNTHDLKTDLQQVQEHQCLVPVAVVGGISLLIILGILAVITCHRRAVLMHPRGNNVSRQHQQSSGETQYASLMFVTGRRNHVAKS